MAYIKMRAQPRVRGGRWPVSSAFIEELEAAVRAEQDRYTSPEWGRPSRSFVIANAVAFALNVDLGYDLGSPTRKKKRGKK